MCRVYAQCSRRMRMAVQVDEEVAEVLFEVHVCTRVRLALCRLCRFLQVLSRCVSLLLDDFANCLAQHWEYHVFVCVVCLQGIAENDLVLLAEDTSAGDLAFVVSTGVLYTLFFHAHSARHAPV